MYSSKKLSMTLLPKVAGLQLQNVAIDAKIVLLSVASTRPSASCPVCGQKTARLHSHYRRTVAEYSLHPPPLGRRVRQRHTAVARDRSFGLRWQGRDGPQIRQTPARTTDGLDARATGVIPGQC